MVKRKEAAGVDKMTPEQERTYWDAQDPLRQGKRVRVGHPQPPEDRLSFFALRLSGRDIVRLADAARQRGMKPSELARALILQGLEQAAGVQDLENRVVLLERRVAELEKRPHESPGVPDHVTLKEELTTTVLVA